MKVNDLFSLQGRPVVLTGAAGFMGQTYSEALVEAGATVVLVDVREKELAELAAGLQKRFGAARVQTRVVDLYDRGAAETFWKSLIRDGLCEILINNAFDFTSATGFNCPEGRLENATYEQAEKCFQSALYWTVQSTQILGLEMKRRSQGVIINIGTMYTKQVPSPKLYVGTPQFNPWGYSAFKGALLQFTRYSAAWLGPEVRVNMLSPGAFPNTQSDTVNPATGPVLERLLSKIVLNRFGKTGDLVGALIFLASDASAYITGQEIQVDGGITITVT